MPPTAAPKKSTAATAKSATTTTKSTTKATTTKSKAPAEEHPDQAQIAAFVKKYSKLTSTNVVTKQPDPVVELYNFNPEKFPFYKNNGDAFTLITPDQQTLSKQQEQEALASLLRLHAQWIIFTPEYNGSSRIKCTLTKTEIVPSFSELKTFYSGTTFKKAWFRADLDPRVKEQKEEAKKAALMLKEAEKRKIQEQEDADIALLKKRQKIGDKMMDRAAQKLVQLGAVGSDSSDSDSDSDSDDGDNDEDDEEDEAKGEEQDKKVQIKMAKKRAQFNANIDQRTGEVLPVRDADGNLIPKKRYIVFVGNLPFNTRTSHLYKLFSKCEVVDIRISTNKLTKQPKGCAFVEFGCPADIHHALGYDGHQMRGRPINVELTAGGGGNSKNRRAKIENKRRDVAQQKLQRFGAAAADRD